MATKRRKKFVDILHDAKLDETTAKQLTRVATSDYSPIHPVFKRVLGNMFLAAAHPGGFNEGMRTQVFLEMMGKVLPWLNKERGRAVHIANDGKDINFMFTEDGKECRGPL
jgi:hypothetical protein